jgi:hypothetical protein
MQKDNVTSINSKVLNLENVKELLNNWRSSKKKANEGMPVSLWEQIFALLGKHTETEIRQALHLTQIQLERGRALIDKQEQANKSNSMISESLEFCEVQEKPTYPLAYKPAEAFATNTCVVELYRPDGMLMKIHICTDSFNDLLQAFYKGSQ